MQPSQNAFNLATQFESCYLESYQDSRDIWTIGFGHTNGVQQGDTCTQEQADQWLQDDMADAANWVTRLVITEINQNQFDALSDLFFNVGHVELQTSHLLQYVNARQFGAAANEFPKWNHSGGVVLLGLTRRRLAEQALFNEQ